ncbi:MAG: glycosyltransferase family 1 protein [Gemmatimonadetes bacterium]|nr:glycosyltransferase family 1 protein [Gemmatimonadota bacterium]
MRVLYCTDTWPPQVNGVSVVTSLSVDGLRARGWDAHVIAPRYPDATPGAPRPRLGAAFRHGGATAGLGITSLASAPLPLYPDVRLAVPDVGAIGAVVARFRPDLVHCATEFVIGRLGQLVAGRAGLPVVSSFHTDFGRYAAAYGAPWLAGGIRAYLGRFHARAARTFTPSTASRDEVRRLGARDAVVWGRGVDTGAFTPARRSLTLRQRLGLGDAFTVLYVGRLAPEKSVDVVLDGFARAVEERPDLPLRLVVAGAGPSERRLRHRAAPHTIWLGNLDRATELPPLYASADCFAFASTTETLGLVVLEAMASGLPVVAVPAGGVSDHLRDRENGLAVPSRDAAGFAAAIVALASDRALSARLACGALATARALDWAHELDRLDESYREVCDAAHATRPASPAAG